MILLRASWSELDPDIRHSLQGKLRGMYGFGVSDEEVFDWLAHDKQQALQLLVERFVKLKIWRCVMRLTNVYGIGGIGCEFLATDNFAAELRRSSDFTSRFARHKNAHRGFYERRRPRLVLHLLQMKHLSGRWSAHFDLHSPVASLSSLWRHLWHERLRGATPAATEIAALIKFDNR